jgi:hypothetical protein
MSEERNNLSEFETAMIEQEKPGSIKTLTILTFIGNALGIFFGVFQYLNSAKSLNDLETMPGKPEFEKMPEMFKGMFSAEAIERARMMDANKLPILIINLIGCILCIYGAIEMRKLKLNGFYVYVVGSILPLVGLLLFIGLGYFTGWAGYSAVGFTLLFIGLYYINSKYLTK